MLSFYARRRTLALTPLLTCYYFLQFIFHSPAENSPHPDLTIAALLNAHSIEAADSASTTPNFKVAFLSGKYKSESLILIRAFDLGAGAGKGAVHK